MTAIHHIDALDTTVQTTHQWLAEICQRLDWTDQHQAYHALRAVLHALRDRLSVNEAAAFGAQLPLLVRGIYYEGWHPAGKPLKFRTKSGFLAHLAPEFRNDPAVDLEKVSQAVFDVVAGHISAGEVDSVIRCMPPAIRELWV
ncbi:MAG: DUF2267 domain-containing protein [Planctomycetes bacterium]|nr:DUF2267 domain-containing protein [Planctomycetota bacterium]